MLDEKNKEYIDRLNIKQGYETIFIRQISYSVDVARVWDKEPELYNDSTSSTFFLSEIMKINMLVLSKLRLETCIGIF